MKAILILILVAVVMVALYLFGKNDDKAYVTETTEPQAVLQKEMETKKESFVIEDPDKIYPDAQ